MRGEWVDFNRMLTVDDGKTRALGNARMNSRGDVVNSRGEIVKTQSQIEAEWALRRPQPAKNMDIKKTMTPEEMQREFLTNKNLPDAASQVVKPQRRRQIDSDE
tara:strand:- start:4925 stop:5236 length:312 start_codon:yes stop_codon:yes gene_type:complete